MDQYETPLEVQGCEGLPAPVFCSPIKQEPEAAGRGVGAILLPGPGKDPLLLGEWWKASWLHLRDNRKLPTWGNKDLESFTLRPWCPWFARTGPPSSTMSPAAHVTCISRLMGRGKERRDTCLWVGRQAGSDFWGLKMGQECWEKPGTP